METLIEQVGAYAPVIINAVKAVIVLIIGWIAARWISSVVRKRVNASKRIDKTIGNFASSIVRWLILLITFVAILNLFGIEATSLVAMLGAATLAIGLALQGTLSDLAAGFMLILFRPYKVGDFTDIGGTSGTVVDINLFFTELKTPDGVQIVVPNGQGWGAIITNYSFHPTRRCDLTFGIDYDDDANKAMSIIMDVVKADERAMTDPEPWVRVTNLGDSSVDITLRVWAESSVFWDMKFHLLQAIKEAFDANGISIPYPHQTEVQKTPFAIEAVGDGDAKKSA